MSDLGHTQCRMWAEDGHVATYVCSPRHTLMNIGFVAEGLCVIGGTLWSGSLWRKDRKRIGKQVKTCFMLVGIGLIISGLSPADFNKHVHQGLGALPIALFGNLGLLLTYRATIPQLRWLGITGILLGCVGVIGFVLFLNQLYLGLGPGGMERVWGFSLLIWTFLVSVYLLVAASIKPVFTKRRIS